MASEQVRNSTIRERLEEGYVDVQEELDERKAAVLRGDEGGLVQGKYVQRDLLVRVFNFDPDEPAPPVLGQFSYEERAARLREKAGSCCRDVYRMPPLAHHLLMANLPHRFDVLNGPPQACVQIDLHVTKALKSQPSVALASWTLTLHADPAITTPGAPGRPLLQQAAHYGYTVAAKSSAKTTGRIWFPDTKQPLHYRPWHEKVGERVAIGTQIKEDRQHTFKLTGVYYNQYKIAANQPKLQ